MPQPNNRPCIEDVLQCLERVANLSEPPSFRVDEETEEDFDDWGSVNDSSAGEEMEEYDDDRDSANGSPGPREENTPPVYQDSPRQIGGPEQAEQPPSVTSPL